MIAAPPITNVDVTVPAQGHDYTIHIGQGLLARAGELLAPWIDKRAFIITDRNAAQAGLNALKSAWRAPCTELFLPPGEGSKTPDTLMTILSWLMAGGLDRDSVVIALGGGVVGDIAGLAAALAMRGVKYIQIPTTLLAQVDSAVGGKVAVNMAQGKNMIGAFHQPVAVLADVDVLKSLPPREMRAGYAEIVKYALIDDAPFFTWLEAQGAAVLAHAPTALIHAVATSCAKKAAIVAADEREEKDIRALLNLGHSFAHGIESAAGYDGSVLHGEAVAAGLALAARFSQAQGLCHDAERIIAHLSAVGLPTDWRKLLPEAALDTMVSAMARDKKSTGGQQTLILLRGVGQAFVSRQYDLNQVRDFLAQSQK